MKIGVVLESMGLPLRQGLPQAAKLGVGGVQFNAIGDFAPERLADTARRELKNLLKTFDQQITALNCPLRHALDETLNQQPRIEYVRNVMTLAFEFGARIVIAPFPKLPGENEPERARLLREALTDLGRHGDRVGSVLALEIGFDPPEAVRDYLATFDVGSLKVNYDPANMLANGFDPVKGIVPLHRLIAHTHARDARKVSVSRGVQEVALGAGDVDWLSYVATMASVEYRGWLTIERERTDDAIKEMERAVGFLKRMVVPG
ncbi:MAG: sugar phosphate isomerase/epimerase [Gemmataceae bacterium]|nr:sugar phosphate isomerase/epimerase [Gemmataceae bacterium]